MKRLLLIPLLLALSACGGLTGLLGAPANLPASPSAIANTTKLDEQAALGVELAYQAANRATYFAAKAGVLSPDAKLRAAELDNTAYKAVLATRAAYDAGNATSYAVAATRAQAAISTLLAQSK